MNLTVRHLKEEEMVPLQHFARSGSTMYPVPHLLSRWQPSVPAHRQHGLARSVMIEGLHRLKRMGCKVAFVGGYSEAANAL